MATATTESSRWLRRDRLLSRLPDSAGRVVWLQAPYGYGKSVLAAQWVAALEAAGWRGVWVSGAGREPRAGLARALELPSTAPWPIVLDALRERPTVTVIEDLAGEESLTPLLAQPVGLVLIASRRPLREPELPRLASRGLLLRLGAAELAFTRDEARRLFRDVARADRCWERSGGWPLPLHLAALAGDSDADLDAGLLAGVRASLPAAAWQAALVLACVDVLPEEAIDGDAASLAASGFAHRPPQGGGLRIHPLLADMLRGAFPQALGDAVRRWAPRLPPLVRGAAFERAGLRGELAELLATEDDLARQDPEAVLRWDALASRAGRALDGTLPEGGHWLRAKQVGEALCLRGRPAEGLATLRLALRLARQLDPPDVAARLLAGKELMWHLAEVDRSEARVLADTLMADVESAPPESAGRFLSDLSRVAFLDGDRAEALALTERALARYPPDSPRRFFTQINLGILRFDHAGDLEARIQSAEDALPHAAAWIPEHLPGIHMDLGRLYLLLGARDAARLHLTRAATGMRARPWINLAAEVLLHVMQHDDQGAAAPASRLRAWNEAPALDAALGLWAWALVGRGRSDEAVALLEGQDGFLARTARALARSERGETEAMALLPREDEAPEREPLLYLLAARWRIGRAAGDLQRLLAATSAGARVLPQLVPLSDLPRTRPDLAAAYPLADVLASGWKAAIRTRLPEVAPLRISLLGGVRVERDGAAIELSPRLQEIVALLALGHSREQIADALWPGLGVHAARNNLHVNLNKLRRILEPWGVPTYLGEDGRLHAVSDVRALDVALGRGDAAEVLALYAGDLAAGVDLPELDGRRERLRRAVVELLLRAATGAPASEAERMLTRVVELDPLNEPAVRALIGHLAASGRRARAAQLYETFRVRLADEIGARPQPQTRAALDRHADGS